MTAAGGEESGDDDGGWQWWTLRQAVTSANDDTMTRAPGCKKVTKESSEENYTYSNTWDGKTFQDGTTVTLSCSSGPVIGQPLMRCDNGKWTPKLGRCGSNCSQEFLRKLGYSEMRVNGSRKDGDAPHNSDVEFICGEEAHKYHCYDGTFLSQSAFEPCGSCSTADVAGLGYAGMNVHGNTLNGHLVEGSAVSLLCRDGETQLS
ncbi:unnamed protein product [Heligmosomoides polygyrus]|uniref:Sushi domain-containing protein n=1 Tax=Heligmosomoides polygyrus TaxID=6339 RepID=A0A183FDQ9_HELPZ|nr:unnamed protein product [Heligmosomoides polygyrus]